MWTCPTCERNFKSNNQSHMCSTKTIDEVFQGKPDSLLLAFDQVLVGVIDWEPCSVGCSVNTIIFTKEKAWLIVKPMSKELDLKFYYPEKIDHHFVKKSSVFRNSVAHHIRITNEDQVTPELLSLLRMGFDGKK